MTGTITYLNSYTVYACGDKDYCDGVQVNHVGAKEACEHIAFDRTKIQRVKYLGTVKGCSQKEIHVYEDEHNWIYNVVRNYEKHECFVLDVDKAAEGNIGFDNKWRGDQFMDAILASDEWKAHDKQFADQEGAVTNN